MSKHTNLPSGGPDGPVAQGNAQGRLKIERKLGPDGYVEEMFDMNSAIPFAAEAIQEKAKEVLSAEQEMVKKTQDAYDAIMYMSREIKEPFAEVMNFSKQTLAELREQRIAIGMETRSLMQSLKEVRQFFLESDYEQQVHRLHEFVDVCERLQALKKSGFIDAIADTILNLSEGQT
jgi:hypothetical protein